MSKFAALSHTDALADAGGGSHVEPRRRGRPKPLRSGPEPVRSSQPIRRHAAGTRLLALVEPRCLVRECLAAALSREVETGVAALPSLAALADLDSAPGLVLLSLPHALSRCAGPDDAQIRRLVAELGATPVMALIDDDDAGAVFALMAAGARACIPANSSLAVTIEAIRLVEAGGSYVPPCVLARRTGDSVERAALFTSRQSAVVEAIRRGKANKMIAHELNMRESTVKVHVRNIMRKLNARNRTEVAWLAGQMLEGRQR